MISRPSSNNGKNRMPEHARAFHGDHSHTQFMQPIIEPQQITGHGRKGTCFFLEMPIGLRDQGGGHSRLLMDIDSSTAFIDHLHNEPPRDKPTLSAVGGEAGCEKNGQGSSACSWQQSFMLDAPRSAFASN
jgi:hypothetical protein